MQHLHAFDWSLPLRVASKEAKVPFGRVISHLVCLFYAIAKVHCSEVNPIRSHIMVNHFVSVAPMRFFLFKRQGGGPPLSTNAWNISIFDRAQHKNFSG